MITPQTEAPELAKKLGVPAIFLKREDLHPYGSHKGRSIPYMIDVKCGEGVTHFAISSSGNAALAAIRHIKKLNALKDKNGTAPLFLSIFIGEHIEDGKRATLENEASSDPHIKIETSRRPLQSLLQFISGTKNASLRQSLDDTALVGYESLAQELASIPNLSDIFIATSSGTTAQAISQYFVSHTISTRIHVVQTTSVSPIAQEISKNAHTYPSGAPSSPEESLAKAIIDKVAHRRLAVTTAIQATNGTGIIATNKDITGAQKLLKETASLETTANGALSLAGLIASLKKGSSFKGTIACIISGK